MPRASNRGNPTPAMSQLSAALTIWSWIVAHGRVPEANECTNKNGLHHHRTYYRVFEAHNFSAEILPKVSALVAQYSTKQCIGYTESGKECQNRIPDEGPHVRMCHTCRSRNNGETIYTIPMRIERLTLRELGAGRGGWERYEGWVRDVDWGDL